ncbi:MAG: hypothetical protein DRI46_10650 [Chloroflexi bacterium]|nr:MAG: hypothetical protein DRI46_10650 [Chloroflexota bacterium]
MEIEDTVRLTSNDGMEFEVEIHLIQQSGTLKDLTSDCGSENAVPLPNVDGRILGYVLDHFRQTHENPAPAEEEGKDKKRRELADWNKKFFEEFDNPTIFEIILAANFLDAKFLLDTTCKVVANLIKGKSTEEMRKVFNIKNDFSKLPFFFYYH